jgi:hypothetical protein
MKNQNGYKILQLFKWIAFVAAALFCFLGIAETANDAQMAALHTTAIFFMLLAIFFHLEQHKS